MVLYLRYLLYEQGIRHTKNDSHITPIVIADASKCKTIADALLWKHGVYVQPVNYPTVPRGEACLRIIVTSRHTIQQVEYLVTCLNKVLNENSANYLQTKSPQFIAS
jgi:5-aminolevulinate synthase